MKRKLVSSLLILSLGVSLTSCQSSEAETTNTTDSTSTMTQASASSSTVSSPIVTTGQTATFDGDGNIISTSAGDAFYGQDGDYESLAFSFTLNDDGTTTDNNTGLVWETIPLSGKMTWEEAVEYCENLTLGGYDDWRLPTVEELFSISDFSEGWPYLDTAYFEFGESELSGMAMGDGSPQGGSPQGGDASAMMEGQMGERGAMAEGEMAERGTMAEGTMPEGGMAQGGQQGGQGGMQQGGAMMAEGAMPEGEMAGGMAQGGQQQGGQQGDMAQMPADATAEMPPMEEGGVSKDDGQFWTASYNMVEGDERLGDIAFGVNHSTGHIKAYPADSSPEMGKYVRAVRGDVYGAEDYTDNGDGTITDNASGLMWLEVDLGVAVDWEEALSLAESSEFAGYDDWRLPDVKELQSIVDYSGSYPAINQDYFTCTELSENENYYFWTSTSAYFSDASPEYNSAWYVAFGYTSHGAGAVRFSPKYEGSDALSEGEDNILNSVRLVRTVD